MFFPCLLPVVLSLSLARGWLSRLRSLTLSLSAFRRPLLDALLKHLHLLHPIRLPLNQLLQIGQELRAEGFAQLRDKIADLRPDDEILAVGIEEQLVIERAM